ncbi:MAG: sulfotransferase family protein [Planctomycetota bacterium]
MADRHNPADVPFWLSLAGRMVEKHPGVFKKLGALEAKLLAQTLDGHRVDRPIYIAGLARAGSTVLLELLAAGHQTATHRYRDFPFVHLPVWWNVFIDRASGGPAGPVERFHQDRIQVTADSPAAMEEPVWMSFFPSCHDPRRSNLLTAETEHPLFEPFYRRHVQKILHVRGGTRYLAKNNYNLSRLGYLVRLFPDARVLIPARDPVGHVASSIRQHRIFSEKQRADRRVRDYLRRAGHFEFGLDRRPINVGDSDAVREITHLWTEGREPTGWARYWAMLYGFVADLLERDSAVRRTSLVVHYDDLCRRSRETLSAVYRHCELEVDDDVLDAQAATLSPPGYYDLPFSRDDEEQIRAETRTVHDRIRALCEI